jgi:hypothetical protein
VLEDRYCVKIYGGKYIKISVCHSDKDGLPSFGGNNRENERRIIEDEEVIENLKRSAKRAYQQLMSRAHGMGVDRMLTLTFAKNVSVGSKDVAIKCFQKFVRLCRLEFGAFDYVATTELQKRGSIHFHLGVTKFYSVWRLWSLWKKSIRESGLAENEDKIGSVFINKKWKQTQGGVVAYIAKYIIKESYKFIQSGNGLRDKFGKRYLSSQVGVEKVVFLTAKGDTMFVFKTFFREYELKNNKNAFIKQFSYINCFVLGVSWSFSDGFLREVAT